MDESIPYSRARPGEDLTSWLWSEMPPHPHGPGVVRPEADFVGPVGVGRRERCLSAIRRAESALGEAIRRGDDLTEAVPTPFLVLDRRGCLVRWNRWVEVLTGLGAASLCGHPALEAIAPDDRPRVREAFRAALAGESGRVEGHLLGRSGASIPFLWYGTPLRNARGRVAGIVVSGLDAAEHKAAEERRLRGENLLRTVVDSAQSVVYVKDPEGRYQLINQKWADLFHVTKESVVGRTDHDMFPAEIADAFRANDLRVLSGGRAVEMEEVAPHDDGPHTYLSVKVPLIGPDGVPYAICGISTDITERKRMEEALRLGEERFRGAFEAAASGMAIVSPDGRWMRVNRSLCAILGYTNDEMLALDFQSITHADDLADGLDIRRRALACEDGPFLMVKRYIRKGGGIVWARVGTCLVRDTEGKPLHFVTQVEDITPQRRAEERARALHAELEDAYDATIAGWARALDLRDHETEGHSRRVTEMTLRLARSMGVPEPELVHIRRGALLHDIGKMGIPDAILRKPGPLDDAEWVVMRRHPELALEMLAPISFLGPALAIPYCHHERWDGAGYPRGLAGEAIPLSARIFAAVDIWDALSNDRPYRTVWPPGRVIAHLRKLAGNHLDPAVVAAFLPLLIDRQAADPEPPPDANRAVAVPAAIERRDASILKNPARLAALRATGLMDSPVEASFDRIVRLAARLLHAPIALISLIDDTREFFKSACGLPEPWASLRQAPLSHSFCREVVCTAAPLVVTDARLDARVCDNPAIGEMGVVAYAGMPLAMPDGHVLGSFCVIDGRPRTWDSDELEILHSLSASVMTEIELLADIAVRQKAVTALRRNRRRVGEQLRIALTLNRELERQGRELSRVNGRLAEMAATDGLTGLRNRRSFAEDLVAAADRAARQGGPLSVILADVDQFKAYNDAFGHTAGDEVLRYVAATIASRIRGQDLAARYGGEEFVVLLPGANADETIEIAERLRAAVESQPWPLRPVTASFGAATSVAEIDGPWELVDQADAALYISKRRGRNRVTHHRDRPDDSPD